MKLIPNGSINNIPVLVHIMAWHLPGDKPCSKTHDDYFTNAYMRQWDDKSKSVCSMGTDSTLFTILVWRNGMQYTQNTFAHAVYTIEHV